MRKIMAQKLSHPVSKNDGEAVSILLSGVGGSGVVTIAALLGMAAHLQGKHSRVLDMTGLSQKNGPVWSHVLIADDVERGPLNRIPAGGADVLLGLDLVVTASWETLRYSHETTAAVVNRSLVPTPEIQSDPDFEFGAEELWQRIKNMVEKSTDLGDLNAIAARLFGNTIYANMVLLGSAFQKGLIPLSGNAIEEAIRLNGVSIEKNHAALRFGRYLVDQSCSSFIEQVMDEHSESRAGWPETAQEQIAFFTKELERYQDTAYAGYYRTVVERVLARERTAGFTDTPLTEAVSHSLFKLMAYKDEYEVARLLTDRRWLQGLRAQFDGPISFTFHMSPPALTRPGTKAAPRKWRFGSWLLPVLRILKHFKWLRGTRFDPFGYTTERKLERQLLRDFVDTIEAATKELTSHNRPLLVDLATLPQKIRGYGHVKHASIRLAKSQRLELLRRLRQSRLETASSTASATSASD